MGPEIFTPRWQDHGKRLERRAQSRRYPFMLPPILPAVSRVYMANHAARVAPTLSEISNLNSGARAQIGPVKRK